MQPPRALRPTHKDPHDNEKAYQKTRNFNALQATLFNGKYLLEHAQMKHDIPFVTIKITVVECY